MSLVATLAEAPVATRTPARETADEAAARLGVDVEEVEALRASLGCHFDEISRLVITDEGPVIEYGGAILIFRPESKPDAAGNFGWLFYARPDGNKKADAPQYATPVFQPSADELRARAEKAKPSDPEAEKEAFDAAVAEAVANEIAAREAAAAQAAEEAKAAADAEAKEAEAKAAADAAAKDEPKAKAKS